MERLSGAIGSVVDKARRMVGIGATGEARRQTFLREFGKYPAHFEASPAEREEIRREVVQPVLAQRARAVQQAAQERGPSSAAGTGDQPQPEAEAAFARAYQAAVDLGLAEKGRTYRDYLG